MPNLAGRFIFENFMVLMSNIWCSTAFPKLDYSPLSAMLCAISFAPGWVLLHLGSNFGWTGSVWYLGFLWQGLFCLIRLSNWAQPKYIERLLLPRAKSFPGQSTLSLSPHILKPSITTAVNFWLICWVYYCFVSLLRQTTRGFRCLNIPSWKSHGSATAKLYWLGPQ